MLVNVQTGICVAGKNRKFLPWNFTRPFKEEEAIRPMSQQPHIEVSEVPRRLGQPGGSDLSTWVLVDAERQCHLRRSLRRRLS